MLDTKRIDSVLEQAGVVLVLAVLATATFLFGGVRATDFFWVTLLVGLAGLVWLIRLWVVPSHKLLLAPVLAPIAGFLGYALWRTSQADVPYVAWEEMLWLVTYALVFVLVIHNIHGQDAMAWTVHALVGFGILLSLYSLMQFFGDSLSVLWLTKPDQYFKRASGTFVNPNHLAGWMVQILPLALAQVFLGRGSDISKVVHGYGAVMMLTALALTMSRGGWLATAVVVGLFFGWLAWRRRNLRVLSLTVMAVVILAGALFLMYNEKARTRVTAVSVEGHRESGLRDYLWSPALKMWQDNPWWGVGPAHYNVQFPAYRPTSMQLSPGYVHNEYIQMLVDFGLIGALLLALGVGTLIHGVHRSQKYVDRGGGDLGRRGSNRIAVFLGASIGLVGLAVHCAGDFLLHIPGVALIGVTLGGLVTAHWRFATEQFWVPSTWWNRFLVTALLGTGLSWMLWTSWHYAQEGKYLNQAAAIQQVTPELVETLEKAQELAPTNPRTAYELGENLRRLSWQGLPDWRDDAVRSIEWLEKAAKLNPYDPYPHYRMGLTWYWLEEMVRARESFERAVALAPNDVEIHVHYGWFLLNRGQVEEARLILEQTLEWNWWDNWLAQRYLEEINAGKWGTEGRRRADPAP
jgi:O-antigen ligase